MSLTINTVKLQEMVSRSMQAVSNNAMLPITGMMSISVEDGTLTLLTTDRVHYLYVTEDVEAEDMQVTVNADAFAKLVNKLTTETVKLTVKDSALEIKANGKYNLEIPMDENGVVKFDCPYKTEELEEDGAWSLEDIKSIVTVLKPSIAVTEEVPMYMNYYVGESVVATNEITVASKAVQLLKTPKLISAKTMSLLSSFKDSDVSYEIYEGNVIVFDSSDSKLITLCSNTDGYPIDVINGFVEMPLGRSCVLSKGALLSALDRLSLFVGAYDNNAVKMSFDTDGVTFESFAGNGTEIVPYIKAEDVEEFSCAIDVRLLQTHVKSQSDEVEMWYGVDNCIKLEDDGTTVVISLVETE